MIHYLVSIMFTLKVKKMGRELNITRNFQIFVCILVSQYNERTFSRR